ncbi:MAG: hypothetical protein ACKO14_13990 [Armatimonadota bacterium]
MAFFVINAFYVGLATPVTLTYTHYEWATNATGTVDVGYAMQTSFTNGLALDNVSVHAMPPEPGTFALAGLGLPQLSYY